MLKKLCTGIGAIVLILLLSVILFLGVVRIVAWNEQHKQQIKKEQESIDAVAVAASNSSPTYSPVPKLNKQQETEIIESALNSDLASVFLLYDYDTELGTHTGESYSLQKLENGNVLFKHCDANDSKLLEYEFPMSMFRDLKYLILSWEPHLWGNYTSRDEILKGAITIYDGKGQSYLLWIYDDGVDVVEEYFESLSWRVDTNIVGGQDQGSTELTSNTTVNNESENILQDNSYVYTPYYSMMSFVYKPWEEADMLGAPAIADNLPSSYFKDLQKKTYVTKDGEYFLYGEIASELKPYFSEVQDNDYELPKFSLLTTKSKQIFVQDLFKCANAYVCAQVIMNGRSVYDGASNGLVRDLYTSLYYLRSMDGVLDYDIISSTYPCYIE